ncbi:MAG: ferrous iron transport protein A, partial [Treponema sp.]|nr:ferrous iron transport protein A [Treponema sp.]
VTPGVEVTLIKLAPMGDPMEIRIRGYELTLRLADAEKIIVTPVDKKAENDVPTVENTWRDSGRTLNLCAAFWKSPGFLSWEGRHPSSRF